MEQNKNKNICPICQQSNQCEIEAESSCWCMTVQVPKELIARLTKDLQGTQCICKNCIEKFS